MCHHEGGWIYTVIEDDPPAVAEAGAPTTGRATVERLTRRS
jgi:hypothetical protein